MVNYQHGKIYKVVCNNTGLTFYGFTCEPTLARRLAKLCGEYRSFLENKGEDKSVNRVLEGNNYDIVLVEKVPSDSKDELYKRLRHYIENNECVNKRLPVIINENSEKKNEAQRKWYEKNKERISDERFKKYNRNWIIHKIL